MSASSSTTTGRTPPLNALPACDIAAAVREGRMRAVDVAQAAIAAVRAETERLNSYVTVLDQPALARAEEIDRAVASGQDPGPLAGVPVAIKDNMMVQGARTTCASRILGDYIAPYDATAVARLKQAGAVLIGKTNMDEFAMGSSTEYSAFGGAKNPWDESRIPGGSSGGSAVTVASRSVPIALGSDTGGSIRQPASHCGVLGMKPTYGRVSRYGLVAFASSLDQIGPFGRTVADLAAVLSVISGHDERDSTSAREAALDDGAQISGGVRGLRIGIPREYVSDGLDEDVRAAVLGVADAYRDLGATVEETTLPHTDFAVAAYYIIAPAEASSNLARYDGMRYGLRGNGENLVADYFAARHDGFGDEVKRRIMIGTFALSSGYYDAYYAKASRVRTLIIRDFSEAFRRFDLLLTPVSPTPAFRFGEKVNDPLTMYLSDICTIPANLAGIPGLSVPCGFSRDGLPIGFQLLAAHFEDRVLLRAAQAFLAERGAAAFEKMPGGVT